MTFSYLLLAGLFVRAKTISVLADYHCYFHVGRPDAGNAAFNRIDPPSYYGYVRGAATSGNIHSLVSYESHTRVQGPVVTEVLPEPQ